MTPTEILLLWAYMAAALFFGWQMGQLFGYWSVYGWPRPRWLRRWVMARRLKKAESAFALWAEVNQEEARLITASMTAVALSGVTCGEALEAFAAMARGVRGELQHE